MNLKAVILVSLTAWGLSACAASEQPINPDVAEEKIGSAWQAGQHVVWELEWPAAPIGGPLTIETWRADRRYRYEILEAAAPALVGQTLIFDGQTAWRFNRFETELPIGPTSPILSPVTDAFAIIDKLISTPPATATQQEPVQLSQGPAQQITLTFDNDDCLTFLLDQETQLPVRILFMVREQQARLRARSLEPLPNPPQDLFKPIEFAQAD
jgi:hypothetical protein